MKDTKIKSLYLHVPFCKHLCNYCDFYKKKLESENDFSGFEKHLLASFEKLKNFLDQNEISFNSLETLYLGGGTPSLWGKRGADFLQKHILSKLPLDIQHEFTLEVDPDSYDLEALKAFQDIGVNRFSVGMQSFDEKYLRLLDRQHTKAQCEKLFSDLGKLNASFTTDFLIGAPDSEGSREILKELEDVLKFQPEHLSLYILTTRSNYLLKEKLPSEEWIAKEFLEISAYLSEQGFEHYEVSNFAKNSKYSKHNLAYWDHRSVVALGPNATGLIHLKDKTLRYQWKSTSASWTEEELDEKALSLERLFLGLRTMWGISLNDHFQGNELKRAKGLADSLEKRGLATFKDLKLSLTPRGFLLQDSIMDEFFRASV